MIDGIDVRELKQGYKRADNVFCCLFCEQKYLSGDIYTFSDRMVEASTAIRLHIQEAHCSAFDVLIAQDKKHTGLTNVQSELLAYFYEGIPDKEIAARTNTSQSTVRYQRFNFKEKARQARVFLALYELMDERSKDEYKPKVHEGATMVDERYMTSEAEAQKITETFFSSMNPLILKSFSPKEKKKLVILRVIAGQFEKGRKYEEKELNDILKAIYEDYVTIRRYLIEYGFMDRTSDCKEYWLK